MRLVAEVYNKYIMLSTVRGQVDFRRQRRGNPYSCLVQIATRKPPIGVLPLLLHMVSRQHLRSVPDCVSINIDGCSEWGHEGHQAESEGVE